ncbi:permease [Tersicoccus solisilvae]|uniref:Permease n=1 Tax=Tersicoccus solisilvae TaxID=1882339 RepID=A0ABQ1NLU7_9MICC|nr:AEC family transporter [Tersicoccus solisilvae]GGC80315.1 permease [Tersicoccus solisilvae]
MSGVLAGFSIVWVVIGIGYLIGRSGVLGPSAQQVLSRTVFFVGTPALMLVTFGRTDLHQVFSVQLLAAAASAGIVLTLYLVWSRVLLRRTWPTAIMTGATGSLVNAANLGIPIAVYVLGDAAVAAPIIVFQMTLLTPLVTAALDVATARRGTSAVRRIGQVAANPVLIASVVGILLSVTGIRLPDLVLEPFRLISGIAVPGMLLAFGIGLHGSRPLRDRTQWVDVASATTAKVVIQPLIALALGALVLGLSGRALFAVVVMAALPTAQNAYVVASRYGAAVGQTKDTVLVTTVLSVPVLVLVAALLA